VGEIRVTSKSSALGILLSVILFSPENNFGGCHYQKEA
jgi:hypothetical protein